MTPRQLEANRSNSLKSTGPKTPKGKAIARMNAVKHGILSHEMIVCGSGYKESVREYRAFQQRWWQELEPAGPMEESLVDGIVTNRWRWRRVLVAETGEIAHSVESGCWDRKDQNPSWLRMMWFVWGDPTLKMQKSSTGILLLTRFLERIRESVEREGELTATELKRLEDWFDNKPNLLTGRLAEFRAALESNPNDLDAEALRTRHRQEVLEYVRKELRSLEWSRHWVEDHEERDEEARRCASVLPSAETLDKILRYETTLDRQFFRLMHQLERLQRMRKGEHVPPPLTMEVSQKC